MLKQLEKLEREGTDVERIKSLQDRYNRRVKKCIKKPCWVKAEDIGYLLDEKTSIDFDEFEGYTLSYKKKKLVSFQNKKNPSKRSSKSRKTDLSVSSNDVNSPKVEIEKHMQPSVVKAQENSTAQNEKVITSTKKKKRKDTTSKK